MTHPFRELIEGSVAAAEYDQAAADAVTEATAPLTRSITELTTQLQATQAERDGYLSSLTGTQAQLDEATARVNELTQQLLTAVGRAANPDDYASLTIAGEASLGLYGSLNGIPRGVPLTLNTAEHPVYVGSTDPTKPLLVALTKFTGFPEVRSSTYVDFLWDDLNHNPRSSTGDNRPCLLLADVGPGGFVNVKDCDIHVDLSTSRNLTERNGGILGTRYNAIRNRIWNVGDGLYLTKGNVGAYANWIGRLLYRSPDGRPGDLPFDRSHPDGIQSEDGSDYDIAYNFIDAQNEISYGQAMVPDNGLAGSAIGYTGPGGVSNANSCISIKFKPGTKNVRIRRNILVNGRSGANLSGAVDNGAALLDTNRYGGRTNRGDFLIVPRVGAEQKIAGLAGERLLDGSLLTPRRWN